MLLNEKLPNQLWEFSAENCPDGSLAKFAKFHTNPYNFEACLPNPYKLFILGDIWRAVILPFLSSKYFHLNIFVFQTNEKQPYSFLVLSRLCNGLLDMDERWLEG